MRDVQLKALRPELQLSVSDSTEIESFQNLTLRPLLKLQDPITSKLLANSDHFNKLSMKIDKDNEKAYEEIVTKYLNSNIFFKNRIIGCIVGMMTEEEMDFYLAHTPEINKRIIGMQIRRFVD